MLAALMFAQDLVETGFLDSLAAAVTNLVTSVEISIEDHPWLWIAALVVCLVLLLRPKR